MRKKITPCRHFYCSETAFHNSESCPLLISMISLIHMHHTPAQFENLGRGLEGDEKGRLLTGLDGEDRQTSLSWGHDCQGLHLPSPTGGLLEVDLQHVLQLWAIQDIRNVEHQH